MRFVHSLLINNMRIMIVLLDNATTRWSLPKVRMASTHYTAAPHEKPTVFFSIMIERSDWAGVAEMDIQ
jgi:hypothetical protein